MKRDKKVLGSAILYVKCQGKMINPEEVSFEDYVGSPNTTIRIDLLDGRSLVEEGYRSNFNPSKKYLIEFFDSYSVHNLMNDLMNPEKDFRVTSFEGTIIRMCEQDASWIPSEIKKDPSLEPSKEYIYVRQKEKLFHRFLGIMGKKDKE